MDGNPEVKTKKTNRTIPLNMVDFLFILLTPRFSANDGMAVADSIANQANRLQRLVKSFNPSKRLNPISISRGSCAGLLFWDNHGLVLGSDKGIQ